MSLADGTDVIANDWSLLCLGIQSKKICLLTHENKTKYRYVITDIMLINQKFILMVTPEHFNYGKLDISII